MRAQTHTHKHTHARTGINFKTAFIQGRSGKGCYFTCTHTGKDQDHPSKTAFFVFFLQKNNSIQIHWTRLLLIDNSCEECDKTKGVGFSQQLVRRQALLLLASDHPWALVAGSLEENDAIAPEGAVADATGTV